MSLTKTYSELIKIPSYEGRFKYLSIGGGVGTSTFGSHRYLNQILYGSSEWKTFRQQIIVRDNGCDLAHEDHPIFKGAKLLIHHINPITVDDILNRSPKIFDPENVITTVFDTHQAIHYGDDSFLRANTFANRRPNDTCPWR